MSTTVTRKLISVNAAAERLGLNPRTVWRYIRIGDLPAYRVGTTLVRVDPADVDALVSRVPATHGRGSE